VRGDPTLADADVLRMRIQVPIRKP
jgi:hypothetical protein